LSILAKPTKDLTKKDLAALAKPLGVKGRPYPMRDVVFTENKKGEKTLVNRLGLLEDNNNPLLVFSDREYGDVVGMAMREMPTPSMLPMFFDAIARRHPNNPRRIQFLKGAAGAGKTYMGELVGRMGSEKGALKIDCSNLNMGELLFETVLDFSSDKNFYNELDKRLAAGKLNALSRKLLKENLGEAWSEEGGKTSIDWHLVGQNVRDPAQADKPYEQRDYLPSEKATAMALAALQQVSQLEGLDAMGGNTLGMATQEGALIRAFKEGREVILDEFNRGKRGTTGVLHGVLQFIIGEIDNCTVSNTLKEKGDDASQSFTFRRADMKAGFFVTLTGNTETDGSDVEELPQSLNSRIIPQHVPLATQEDWQHRICQIMTGLPVSTIYYSAQGQWDKNPEAFRKRLVEWRQLQEQRQVPDIQLRLLRRWEDVVEASEKLAKFYYGWSQIVDPDSAMHRAGTLAQLLDEIDDTYSGEVTIDFRKIMAHISEAMEYRPEILAPEDSEGYDLSAALDRKPEMPEDMMENEDPAVQFGTWFSNVLVRHIVATTVERGKMGLYHQLMRHAADCGLTGAQLHEGMRSGACSVADLLNDNPYDSKNPDIQAELVRDLLCQSLRERYKDLSKDNNDIMSVGVVRRALEDLAEQEAAPELTQSPAAAIFNDNPDALNVRPFITIENVDMTPDAQSGKSPATPQAANLVAQREILASIVAPQLRERNLQAMWNKALSNSGIVAEGNDVEKDESLAIAQNDSESGLALTTVMVAGEARGKQTPKAVPLHLVWNRAQDKLLVVGEGKVTPDLKKAFNYSRTVYVDRLEADADKRIASALNGIVGVNNSKMDELLKGAFLMRNMMPSAQDEEQSALGKLMASRGVNCYLPHYLVKKNPAPK